MSLIFIVFAATYTIVHTPESYALTDKNSLFTHTTRGTLDWQPCENKSPDGKETSVLRCRMEPNGVFHLESDLPNGKHNVEERCLESRTVMKQTVEVLENGARYCFSFVFLSFVRFSHRTQTQTRRCIKITRYFRRLETEEERATSEREWAAVSGHTAPQTASEPADDRDDWDPEPSSSDSTTVRVLILLIVVLAVWLPEIFVGVAVLVLLVVWRGGNWFFRRFFVDSAWAKVTKAQREQARAKRLANASSNATPRWAAINGNGL